MAVSGKSAQDFVPVRDIKDGIIVLNDGSIRGILMTSSLNFGLKSPDEQTAIIYQFQNFLNSLEFPIQILIQSKRLDIRPYLRKLEDQEKVQLNDNMKIQVHEYVRFIRDFAEHTNVMSKTFFIVVPFSRLSVAGGTKDNPNPLAAVTGLFGKKDTKETMSASDMANFEEGRSQLEQRMSIIEQGLSRCDVRTTRLSSEAITELFYKKFNPGELESAVREG